MFDTFHKVDFEPSDRLRFQKRNFIIDDKVVATKTTLQYKDPRYDWWNNIDTTEDTVFVKDEKELWDNYNLKVKQ